MDYFDRYIRGTDTDHFKRNVPNAIGQATSLTEKVNQIIDYLTVYTELTDEMLDKWNEVYHWLKNEGLEEMVRYRLNEWLEDGTLEDLINDVLLGNIQKDIEDLKQEMEQLINQFDKLKQEIDNKLDRQELSVTVGNSGDYDTINKALDYIDNFPIKPLTADIIILDDFEFTEQVFIYNKDFRHILIKTKSNQSIEVNDTYLTNKAIVNYKDGTVRYPVIYGENSNMPVISAKFKLASKNKDNTVGIMVNSCDLTLKPQSEFSHFKQAGMFIINSNVKASECIFDDNGNRDDLDTSNFDKANGDGILSWNSQLTATSTQCNYNGDIGFNINNGSNAFISYSTANNVGHHSLMSSSGSVVSAHRCDFKYCIDDALVAYADSHIDARGSNVSFTQVNYGAIATRNGTILMQNGRLNNCGTGAMANRGSTLDLTNAQILGSDENGISCANSSNITATNVEIIDSGTDGIHVTHDGSVNARESLVRNSKRHGVRVYLGTLHGNNMVIKDSGVDGAHLSRDGNLNISHSTVENSGQHGVMVFTGNINISKGRIKNSSERGIFCSQGAFVTAYNTNISGTGGPFDISVYNGGIVSAIGSSGSINYQNSINQVSENGLVLTDQV